MRKSKFSKSQIVAILKEAGIAIPVAEVLRTTALVLQRSISGDPKKLVWKLLN